MALQLSIPVDDEQLIRIYETASPEEQEAIKNQLTLWLKQLKQSRKMALLEHMDAMSEEAQARGLTEDELKRILADDE